MGMNEDRAYLIPQPISLRYEFFPGWGWPEMRVVLLGLMVGGLAFANATWVVRAPDWLRIVALIWPSAVGYFLALPGINGPSFWAQRMAWDHYRRQPTRFLYDWSRPESWEERGDAI